MRRAVGGAVLMQENMIKLAGSIILGILNFLIEVPLHVGVLEWWVSFWVCVTDECFWGAVCELGTRSRSGVEM